MTDPVSPAPPRAAKGEPLPRAADSEPASQTTEGEPASQTTEGEPASQTTEGEPLPRADEGEAVPRAGERRPASGTGGSGPAVWDVENGSSAQAAEGEPSHAEDETSRRSGLRNPEAAVRGLGAGTLTLEAIVLLLAIQPIRIMGGELSGWGIGAVVALAVLAGALAGSMRRRWAWHAGSALQVLLVAAGLLHWSLLALGLIFGAAWAYATSVRHKILH